MDNDKLHSIQTARHRLQHYEVMDISHTPLVCGKIKLLIFKVKPGTNEITQSTQQTKDLQLPAYLF